MGKMVQPFGTSYSDESDPQQASAPPIDNDFDNPAGSISNDLVEFILLGDRENYAIRADRGAILNSNSELAKIYESSGNTGVRNIGDNRFAVTETNRGKFELFIRYLETKFIKFTDTRHTLDMLEIASRYRCPDLEILCVKELDMFLSTKSVVSVFHALWLYNQIIPPQKAKDLQGKSRQAAKAQLSFTPEEYFAALLNNCLQLIEMHAEEVFAQEEMTRLTFKELEMVVKREALQMTSEGVLYDLLCRWSREECLRKNIEINSENRRRVLGALCYAPRFLTMSFADFKSAKQSVELLDQAEIALISDAFKGKKNPSLTPEQATWLESFRKPRPPFPLLPIQLSERSNPKNYPKKMRRYVTELEKENEPKRNCLHKTFLNCVTVFAFIFD